MKTVGRKLNLLGALVLAILITMIIDYMALHDIVNDYVSLKFMEMYGIRKVSILPTWTSHQEWTWIEIMYGFRLLLVGLMGYLIFKLTKTFKISQIGVQPLSPNSLISFNSF